MSFAIREELFSPFAGQTIDICPGCGEEIVSADGRCVRVDSPHGPQRRFDNECFRQYVDWLRLFAQWVMQPRLGGTFH